MGGTAASAGYMIAVPAARIFAREATLTGSIGVLLETGEVSGLLGKLGIDADAIVSGPLKDQPSFTKPLSPQGREVLQGLVMDMYDQFVAMVASGRHMDADRVRAAGGWPRLYRPAGADARPGRRRSAASATRGHWLAQTQGRPGRSCRCEDLRPPALARASAVVEPGAGCSAAYGKAVLSQGVMLDGGAGRSGNVPATETGPTRLAGT